MTSMTTSTSAVKTDAMLPPELAGSFGLVQVGQKWNIEDGIKSKNDDDILNDVAEPVTMKLAAQ
jgi:hypothetical protein